MSHEIETMAYVGETPWHRLGNKIPEGASAREMQEAAGLTWSVALQPLYYELNGTRYPSDHYALTRSDNGAMLDVVPEEWYPLQNDEAFEFFHDFLEAGEATMETAGSLKGGKHIWALAKTNAEAEIVRGDVQKSYILLSNPYTYGSAIKSMLTPIRVVCNNTITMALNSAVENLTTKFSHRRGFDAEEAKLAIRYADQRFGEYVEQAKFIANVRATRDSVIAYLNEIFPASGEKAKRRELSEPATTVLNVLESQPGAEFAEGSWWQAVNAVTFATDHVLGRSDETRLFSAWYGQGSQRKREALTLATKFARAAA